MEERLKFNPKSELSFRDVLSLVSAGFEGSHHHVFERLTTWLRETGYIRTSTPGFSKNRTYPIQAVPIVFAAYTLKQQGIRRTGIQRKLTQSVRDITIRKCVLENPQGWLRIIEKAKSEKINTDELSSYLPEE
jgi:hypothetical protein